MKLLVFLAVVLLASFAVAQQIDPQLAAYMDTIGAIDNHSHVYAPDLPNDQAYDALRCDGLPADQGPPAANFRFGTDTKTTWKALYGVEPTSAKEPELKHPQMIEALRKAHGDSYYDWVLQKSGVDVVLANRVAMTPGLKSPHFRWVPYADALLFPLNNEGLRSANPDRRELFRMEEEVRQAYFKQAGITQLPATLDEYLDKVVRPILQQQKQAGAVAIKFEAAYLRKLNFATASHEAADEVYQRSVNGPTPADYKVLQDYLFHEIAVEAGKLGLAVHIHTGAGCGQFFDDTGS